jgi:hypothetical protein
MGRLHLNVLTQLRDYIGRAACFSIDSRRNVLRFLDLRSAEVDIPGGCGASNPPQFFRITQIAEGAEKYP